MRRVGQARKRDANENAICKALERVGAQVTKISGKGAPDILVRYRGAEVRPWAFEVKSQQGTQTPAQEQTNWPIIRTIDEALEAIGAVKRRAARQERGEAG